MFHHRAILAAVFASAAFALPQLSPLSSAEMPEPTPTTVSSSSSSVSQTSSAPTSSFTAGLASEDPNDSFFAEFQVAQPEPVRGPLGAPIIGPQNVPLDRQSPDFLAPPTTDSGTVSNAKWPFSLSHNRLQTGGWARQQNVGVMPLATDIAGVNMRLEVGAIRELHWHITSEWAFVLKGNVRITAMTPEGKNYEAEVGPGDVWNFPPGIPHSLQATNATKDGAEFILVFDDGSFSEDSTLLLSDLLSHVPKEVLAKNFQADVTEFQHIPKSQLYIFPGESPPPISQDMVKSPQGVATPPLSFTWSNSPLTSFPGGTSKTIDTNTFPISKTISAAWVAVNPGHMREIHWHPTQAEWSYFISGAARVTIFSGNSNARTFNYVAGDVGYVPPSNGHYVENIGNETLIFLEIIKGAIFEDLSLSEWLALSPPELVMAHLNINSTTLDKFAKTKKVIV